MHPDVKVLKAPLVLILAGGAGTRFWPASRRAAPKHILPLGPDGRSLLRTTIDRCQLFVHPSRIHVITTPDQVEVVGPECDAIPAQNIFVEPAPRNTAPAIALGLVALSRRGGGAHDPVVILPADAWVDDDDAFKDAIRRAVGVARSEKTIVTLGVPPDRAATGYGYLELGEELDSHVGGQIPVRSVSRFHEKPDAETAAGYLAAGNFHWNAGIFVGRLGYFWYVMGAIREDLDVAMQIFGAILEEPDQSALPDEYAKLESISFDHAVMEQAPSVHAVEVGFQWSDLGDWHAVGRALEPAEGGRARAERVVAIDATNNVVFAPGKTVALLGVQDLVVVSHGDGILVAPRDRAQDVRAIVDALAAAGAEDQL
jgi:mannose-1-phosphate guanylyltransferase